MTALNLFIPITKIDAKQRIVYGVLTAEQPDKSGEIADYATTKTAYQKWSDDAFQRSQGKSKGNLRSMHTNIAAGKFTDINFDDENKRIEGAAKVVDDDEWKKVEEGVYCGFSHGGDYAKRWNDPDQPHLKRYTPELAEVSLVDNPCLPTATFEYIKADGSTELRKFHINSAQEAQPVMTQEMTKDTKERPQDKGGVVQGFQAKDGSFHVAKADALKRNEEIEAQAAAAPVLEALAKMGEALSKGAKKEEEDDKGEDKEAKKAKTDETFDNDTDKAKKVEEEADKSKKGEKEEDDADKAAETGEAEKADKEPYGDVEYADPGFQEDKKKRYPLDSEKHIRAAWNYINKEKNAAKYNAEHLKHIKDMIVAAWKDKIDKDGPPSAEKTVAASMKKGLHEVARMACLIQELDWLQGCLEMEADWERDDSPLPAELKSQIAELCTFLKQLVAEETDELFDDEDEVEPEVMEMAAGLPKNHSEALSKLAPKLADTLAKAGARHSKADMERVQDIHDTAHEMHKCMGEMAEKCADMHKAAGSMKNTAIDLGAEGEKADDEEDDHASKAVAGELSKMTAKHDALVKVLGDLAPQMEAMLKLVEGQTQTISEQNARLEHLEKQPAPAKGATRAVHKSDDGDTKPTASAEELAKQIDKLPADQKALVLMKTALANPVQQLS